MTHRVLLFVCTALVALELSGCATIWAISHGTKGKPPLDENQRSEEVPQPGTSESLMVAMLLYLPQRQSQSSSSTASSTSTTAANDAALGDITDLRFECTVAQHGVTKVYRAATEYGPRWKKTTALMFVLEGLVATAFYFAIDGDENTAADRASAIFMTGFMGLDALGTGVLFFVPRRDVYETIEKKSRVAVRSDCPEGLVLELAGRTVPVNAIGHVGALGQALLERYMTDLSPGQEPLRVRVGTYSADMYVTEADRCVWARNRNHPTTRTLCEAASMTQSNNRVEAIIDVAPGTFTGPPP